jgi:hypothetical protein
MGKKFLGQSYSHISLPLSLSKYIYVYIDTNTHTYTHTHTYICFVCVMKSFSRIKALSVTKFDGLIAVDLVTLCCAT